MNGIILHNLVRIVKKEVLTMENWIILILIAFVIFIVIAASSARRGSKRPGEGNEYSSSHFYADPHMTNFDHNHDHSSSDGGSSSDSSSGDSGGGSSAD